ncbi:MAG: hypothetical protein KTR18_00910 [Acidiferrobacterales bacterium]|nr:hypothetical protein [Acidiferrobacterales bacterium]
MIHFSIHSRITRLSCALLVILTSALSTQAFSDETPKVQVEEIEVSKPAGEKDASTLWQETKKKTGEAASSAAEYSKVQGSKILEASKTGVAKGAEVVTKESSKAWDATKKATKTAVEFTGEKAAKAGAVISNVVKGGDSEAPVSDKSISD